MSYFNFLLFVRCVFLVAMGQSWLEMHFISEASETWAVMELRL
jgi:hypothetical protein